MPIFSKPYLLCCVNCALHLTLQQGSSNYKIFRKLPKETGSRGGREVGRGTGKNTLLAQWL